MNTTITIRDLLQEGQGLLSALDSARLDAELLLCNLMNMDRSKLYSSPDTGIPLEKALEYKNLVNKRSNGEPLAYITGKKEFWSLDLLVNQYTLIPRPETECLVETALSEIALDSEMAIADLGTGSGAIAIALAMERPHCNITATDICEHAIEVAQINANHHGAGNINIIRSNWFENLQGRFDLIVSNPPYIKNGDKHLAEDGVAYEPGLALCGGEDGMEAIEIIINNAPEHLNTGAWLMIEHGYDQAETVRSIFKQCNFSEINTHCDHAGIERVTSASYQHE